MNHDVAFQPSHLDGKWQYCSLNRRGGYVVCGCGRDDGHETREEAERHFYETSLEQMSMRDVRETRSAEHCEVCQDWTPKYIGSNDFGSWFGMAMHWLCDEHLPSTDEELRDRVRTLWPFEPGRESWHS